MVFAAQMHIINRSRQNSACQRRLWLYCSKPNLVLIGRGGWVYSRPQIWKTAKNYSFSPVEATQYVSIHVDSIRGFEHVAGFAAARRCLGAGFLVFICCRQANERGTGEATESRARIVYKLSCRLFNERTSQQAGNTERSRTIYSPFEHLDNSTWSAAAALSTVWITISLCQVNRVSITVIVTEAQQ